MDIYEVIGLIVAIGSIAIRIYLHIRARKARSNVTQSTTTGDGNTEETNRNTADVGGDNSGNIIQQNIINNPPPEARSKTVTLDPKNTEDEVWESLGEHGGNLLAVYLKTRDDEVYYPFKRNHEEDVVVSTFDNTITPHTFRFDRDERFEEFNPKRGQRFKVLWMDEDGIRHGVECSIGSMNTYTVEMSGHEIS